MPYKIGLTGNIGCGKSAVGAMLAELGAEYVDADHLVHALLATGSQLVEHVSDRFGPEVIAADGGVDRRRLGTIVFADVVIDNSGSPEATRAQVEAAWEQRVAVNISP